MDTNTGLPVKPELHNERWHRIRWMRTTAADNSWPRTIVLTTVLNHYVRAGEDALRITVGKLEIL